MMLSSMHVKHSSFSLSNLSRSWKCDVKNSISDESSFENILGCFWCFLIWSNMLSTLSSLSWDKLISILSISRMSTISVRNGISWADISSCSNFKSLRILLKSPFVSVSIEISLNIGSFKWIFEIFVDKRSAANVLIPIFFV